MKTLTQTWFFTIEELRLRSLFAAIAKSLDESNPKIPEEAAQWVIDHPNDFASELLDAARRFIQ